MHQFDVPGPSIAAQLTVTGDHRVPVGPAVAAMIRSTGSLGGTPGKLADAISTFGGVRASRCSQPEERVEPSLGQEAQPKAVFGDQGGNLPRRHRRHVDAEIAGLRRGYRGPAVRRHRVAVHKPDRRAGIEEHRPGHAQVSASQTSPVPCVRSVPGGIFTVPRNAP